MLTRHSREGPGVERTDLGAAAIADVHDTLANADTGWPQDAGTAASLDLRGRQILNLPNLPCCDIHHVHCGGIATRHPQAVRGRVERDVVHRNVSRAVVWQWERMDCVLRRRGVLG